MNWDYVSGIKRTCYLIATIWLSCMLNINAQTWYETAEERIDTLRKGDFTFRITDEMDNPLTDSVYIRLKKHEFQWGNIVEPIGTSVQSRWNQAVLQKYYNCGVVEKFKWPYMETSEGNVFYTQVDTIYAWAERVGWDVRAHTLIWGGDDNWQMPGWTLSLTGEPLYNACETRVRREVSRYQGTIREYDVINEPLHETWLYEQAGDSIKWNAFKWAREEDPDARLFVNEFNIIVWGSGPAYITAIQEMLDEGAPIDGIGVQGHMEGTLNWSDIKTKFDQLATLGLPIKVTEFDMKIDDQDIDDQSMADSYGLMMRVCFSHPAVEGLIWWGFKDPTWRNGSGIYDENRVPKIAADTVYRLIHEKWSTYIKTKLAADGTISFHGFFGDYEIGVKTGDEYLVIPASCLTINDETEIALNLADALPERPRLISIDHNPEGSVVYLHFDKPMNDPSSGVSDFLLYAVTSLTINSANLNTDPSIIELNLASNLQYGSYYTLCYTPGTLTSTNGGILEIFGPEIVPNMMDPSGVEHQDASSAIQLYPNPFNNELIIDANRSGSFDQVVLIDMNGKEILKIRTGDTKYYSLRTSKLVPGTYQLIVYKNRTVVAKTKMIKE